MTYSMMSGWVCMFSFSLTGPSDLHYHSTSLQMDGVEVQIHSPANTFPAEVGHQLIVLHYLLVHV